MPRDIPVAVPNQIRALIKKNWGDISSFASAHGMDYDGVYSLLVRSGGKRPLKMTAKMAKALGCERSEIVRFFNAAHGEKRREIITKLCDDANLSLPEFSDICWKDETHIYKVVNGASSSIEIQKLLSLVDALKLDLDSFEQLYKTNSEAA